MAIEAFQKAVTAYQGSVPAAEPVKGVGDSALVSISSERNTEFKKEKIPFVQVSDTVSTGNREENTYREASLEAKRSRMDIVSIQEKHNDRIKKAIDEINKNAKNSEAIFGIHDATNRVMIKIVDKDSKKILKEYPPEETLDMIAKVWELAGLMVDEKR